MGYYERLLRENRAKLKKSNPWRVGTVNIEKGQHPITEAKGFIATIALNHGGTALIYGKTQNEALTRAVEFLKKYLQGPEHYDKALDFLDILTMEK